MDRRSGYPVPAHRLTDARLIGMGLGAFLLCQPAFAGEPTPAEVFNLLDMTGEMVTDLAQGKPVSNDLDEGRTDELSVGVARYFPLPAALVAERLKEDNPDTMDIEVSAHGELSPAQGANQFARFHLPKDEAQALLEVEPGDEFNLSPPDIERFKSLKGVVHKGVLGEVEHRYREMLFQRFEAYRHGGADAIAAYAREDSPDSNPGLELRQASSENKLLARYLPALHQAWLDYPQGLPKGVEEKFTWISKTVENRQTAILRHRFSMDWQGGAIVLTREFYAAHSYNSSQWLTGCLPWRGGTVVFQQVRSFTDQVAGVGSPAKHFIGRELLKDKMLKSLERLRAVLEGKPSGG